MTIKEIIESYDIQTVKHRQMYKEVLQEKLEACGMNDVDVLWKHTGKIGRLKILPARYSCIKSELHFFPYKKDGTLSLKSDTLYHPDYDNVDLNEIFEVVANRKENGYEGI